MTRLVPLLAIIALFISYGPAVPAMAQTQHGTIPLVSLASNNPGQLTITWQAPAEAPTDYRIRWAKSDLRWLSWNGVNEAERGNEEPLAGVTSLTLDNLTPGGTYKVQMRSRYYNASRTVHKSSGSWTGVLTQRVMDHPPVAPSGLTASKVTHESVALLWDDPQDARITGYRVLRGTDANNLSTIPADTGNAGTSYTDSTVEAETTYHYAVVAMSRDGAGEQSGTITATTTADTKYKPTPVPPQRVGPRQGPSVTTLISNTGQTLDDSPDTSRATPFTTGAYTHTVSSVALYLSFQLPGPLTPVVRIYEDDSGNPGSTVVATMTNPTLRRNAVNVFTAPANTTLRGSTTYWLVTTNSASPSGTGFQVGATESTNLDVGTAAGWSIGNARFKGNINNPNWNSSRNRHLFQIRGTTAGPVTDEAVDGDVAGNGNTRGVVRVGTDSRGTLTQADDPPGTGADWWQLEFAPARRYLVEVAFGSTVTAEKGGGLEVYQRDWNGGIYGRGDLWDHNRDDGAAFLFIDGDRKPTYLRVEPQDFLNTGRLTYFGDYTITLTDVTDVKTQLTNLDFFDPDDLPLKLRTGWKSATTSAWVATNFTTGTNTGGYRLEWLQTFVDQVTGPNLPQVSLYTNNTDEPGTKTFDFIAPVAINSHPTWRVHDIALAPNTSAATLSASTTYWIVFKETSTNTSSQYGVFLEDTDFDDTGAQPGWSYGGLVESLDVTDLSASWVNVYPDNPILFSVHAVELRSP